jgi:hypothetical protein
VKKPPPFDLALRDSLQPLLPFSIASIPASQSPTPPKGGSLRSKTGSKRVSKQKAAELVEEPMDEDIRPIGSDIGVTPAEVPDPISSHLPRAPVSKHIHLAPRGQANPIRFVPPALKSISSSQACTSSSASPRVLILNDSFHMMLDYKAKHNKFPSTYDDMVVFLTEVHIHLISHSICLFTCLY